MANKTKTKRAGRVGIMPRGDWSATYNSGNGYDILDLVIHNHDSWVSKEAGNKQEPSASSTKWQKHSDGGYDAYNAAILANSAASNANTKADLANTAATGAENVNATLDGTVITVTDRAGASVSADIKGEGLDWSTMTPEEKEELIDDIKADLVFATGEETISAINELT